MNSFWDKFLVYFGLLLILVAIIMMVFVSYQTVRLVSASNALSPGVHKSPFDLEVATAIVALVAGLLFGLRLGLGRRRRANQVEEEDYAVPIDHIDQG